VHKSAKNTKLDVQKC